MKRGWIFVVLAVLALVGVTAALAQDAAEDDDMMTSPVAQVVDMWNTGDLEALPEYVSEDVVVHLPPSLGVEPPFTGLEGYTMNLSGWRAGLPDLKLEPVSLVQDETMAAARVMLTGTQTEVFFGIPPTGAELAFAVNILYEFDASGKILNEWWEWDTTLELIQLGLFTPPAPPQ